MSFVFLLCRIFASPQLDPLYLSPGSSDDPCILLLKPDLPTFAMVSANYLQPIVATVEPGDITIMPQDHAMKYGTIMTRSRIRPLFILNVAVRGTEWLMDMDILPNFSEEWCFISSVFEFVSWFLVDKDSASVAVQ
jgi:hypothetical protein